MEPNSRDSLATLVAVSLIAYVSADVAHHALGHGAACLVLGGQIHSLSSIFVNCSLTGAAIDLAGPFANLLIGLVAALFARIALRQTTSARLFCILAAAFNLQWFALQLVFSAATLTDDWAFAVQEFHVSSLARYGLIAIGALSYVVTVQFIAAQMAPFARPVSRARTIVGTAWLTAGVIACATALLDANPAAAILRNAGPQSLLLSIGLLFVPARAARLSCSSAASMLARSFPWILAATLVGAASIVFLGPGIAVTV